MKKLYKSKSDKVFAGVIGGVGEYFGVDPVILRLAYLLITIFGAIAPGVIVYLFALLIVPPNRLSKTPPRRGFA